ncbi:DNAH7 [Symbiodinium sp. CCMP2592]|nr:DNAH7 [Symbiodinium sp. CCMP2592]
MFGDFFDRNEKPYVQATDPVRTQLTFEEALEEYNGMNASKMNLVFFKDAQEHLARAARIIRQPRGNALLVGVSGVGRKSLARMAAHMAEAGESFGSFGPPSGGSRSAGVGQSRAAELPFA